MRRERDRWVARVVGVALGLLVALGASGCIVTGAGPGGGPHVRVFSLVDAETGLPMPAPAVVAELFAYDAAVAGGVFVALGDVDGDGIPEIVVGPGPGAEPRVRVLRVDADTMALQIVREFLAYDAGFTGGVRVAAGDVDGDGLADVVTAPGPGGGPEVRIFSGADGSEMRSFFAYGLAFAGGVFVAAGDVDGDGLADVVTGTGAGGGPHVKVFSGADGSELASFFAYPAAFAGGVRVAAADVDGDGLADIVTGAGPGGGPHVKVFSGADGSEIRSFLAYDAAFMGGVFVAAADIDLDGTPDLVTGAGAPGGPHVRVFSAVDGRELAGFFAYPAGFAGGVLVAAGG